MVIYIIKHSSKCPFAFEFFNQRKRRGNCSRQWCFSLNDQRWMCSTRWFFFKWLREDFFRESSFRMDHKVFIMVLLFSTDQGILHWKQLPASFFSSLPINENTVESVVCIWFTLCYLLLSVHQWVNADPKWNEKGTFWEKSLVLVMASKIVKHSPSGYFFELFFQLQTW